MVCAAKPARTLPANGTGEDVEDLEDLEDVGDVGDVEDLEDVGDVGVGDGGSCVLAGLPDLAFFLSLRAQRAARDAPTVWRFEFGVWSFAER